MVFKKSKGKLYIGFSFIKGGKKIKIEPNKSYKLVTIDFLFKVEMVMIFQNQTTA